MAAMPNGLNECVDEFRDLLEGLKESNKFLGVYIKELGEFQIELIAFKEKLRDEKFAVSVKDETTLEVVGSVVGFLTEELGNLKELQTDLNGKLRDLEVFSEKDDISVLFNSKNFFDLLNAITNTKKTISQKVKGFNQNKQASELREYLMGNKSKNSQ